MKHVYQYPLIALVIAATLFACAGPKASEGAMVKTYGSVISAPPSAAWPVIRTVFRELSGGQAQFPAGRQIARMTYQNTEVEVECVPHTTGGSVLRVSASRDGKEARAVGDHVLLTIQQTLLRSR